MDDIVSKLEEQIKQLEERKLIEESEITLMKDYFDNKSNNKSNNDNKGNNKNQTGMEL